MDHLQAELQASRERLRQVEGEHAVQVGPWWCWEDALGPTRSACPCSSPGHGCTAPSQITALQAQVQALGGQRDELQGRLDQSEARFAEQEQEQEDLLLCMAEMDHKITRLLDKLGEFGVSEASLFPDGAEAA